jgi:arginyl-tRNA synthetase
VKLKNTSKIRQKSAKNDQSHAGDIIAPKIGKNPPIFPRKNDAGTKIARQNKKSKREESPELIPATASRRVMIEFADPNPFKEIHIGHVRNIALGESFCRLLESQGNLVRRANYEGDVGMHVAKALWALLRGESLKGAYAAGAKAFEASSKAKHEIGELNVKVYVKDPGIMDVYTKGRQRSLDYFETVYRRLGTHFDRYYFESEVAPIGVALVEKHLADGVFEKSEGAIVYRGEKVGLHTRVFVTKERYATYEAKDLALAPLKYSEWPYDLSIIMTGSEQSEYFKVMLAALLEINPDLAAKTRHIPFGMVRLTSGKMSSRTGDVITADWLIEEAKKKIYIILKNNRTNYSKKEKDDIAEKAALAAVKYSMLRVTAISDIAFDLEASVSFEGDSGPYLLYTYARCRSVFRRASLSNLSDLGNLGENPEKLNIEERALARTIMQFPDIVSDAAGNFAPNTVCTYLFHMAQQFNLFYAKHPIIGSDTRLALTAATARVLKNGLYLLGIETLEQM